MKKLSTLLAALFLCLGIAQAQDVYYSGNHDVTGKVWKNNSLLYSLSDSLSIQLKALQVAEDMTVYAAGYAYDTAGNSARVWMNDSCVFYANTNSYFDQLAITEDAWIAAGGSAIWQNGELLYSYTHGEDECHIYGLAIDMTNDDLYVGGAIVDSVAHASVWKNDALLWMADGWSSVEGLCFDGEDLYAAGFMYVGDTLINGVIWQNDSIVYQLENGSFDRIATYNGSVYWSGTLMDTLYIWQDGEVIYALPEASSITALVVNEYGIYCASDADSDPIIWKDGEILYQPEDCDYITGLVVLPTSPQPLFTLTVEADTTGWGTVTGGGMYPLGDTVTIEAIPNVGCEFLFWNDSITDNPRDVVITQDSTFIAHFGLVDYTITTSADPEDFGTVTEGGIYHYGDTITLEAIPNAGYVFEMWNDSVTDNPRDIVVTQDSTFVAHFIPLGYTIETSIDPENAGTVTEGGMYYYGDTLTLEAIPNVGFVFEMWNDSVTDNPRDIVVTQDSSFIALFSLIDYSIEALSDPENGGTMTGGGLYHYGDTISLEAIPNAGFVFEMWNDSVTDNPRDIIVTQDSTFIAHFGLIDYTVVTSIEPEDAGTVTEGGIFHYGDTLTLEVIPNAGYAFVMWNDSITDNPREIVVTQDCSFTALLSLIDYTIETSADPENGGIVTEGGLYHYGDTITLEALPNTGYFFEMWSDSITDNPRDIVVTQDSTFVAHFGLIDYNITALVDPEGTANVTGVGTYHYGDTITLEVVPNAGFVFETWNDNVTDNPRDIVVIQDSTFTAHLTPIQCIIETQVVPEGTGIVNGGGTFTYGDTITLEAIPNVGFEFLTWSDGNQSNPRTIVVTESQTYTATFGLKQCVVNTVSMPEEGGIVIGGGTYSYGDTILLVAQNNVGYIFKAWRDEVLDNPRQIIVEDDVTYTAIFSLLHYQITTSCEPAGGGTVEGGGTYAYGETAVLRARPYPNYSFVCWSDGIVSNPRYVTVSQDASYKAFFRFDGNPEYIIKVIANNHLWGTVEGTGVYPEGSTVEIKAIPTDSTQFVRWDDGNTDNPRTITVTSDMVFTAIFEPIPVYTITVRSANTSMGTVYGGGTYMANTVIEIGAIPEEGFYFTGWQDGDMNNPRTIIVTEDAEYEAHFSRTPTPTFTVTVYYDENQGFILGAGTYSAGSTASLAAIPADGYMFVKWSDETTDNPKEVLVDHDIVLAAFFTGTSVGENGFENINLYPNPANDIIHIEGLEGEHEVQIYNAIGMLVMTTTLQGDSEINISDLPSGYYLIRIDNRHAVKFIKENK